MVPKLRDDRFTFRRQKVLIYSGEHDEIKHAQLFRKPVAGRTLLEANIRHPVEVGAGASNAQKCLFKLDAHDAGGPWQGARQDHGCGTRSTPKVQKSFTDES